MIERVFIEEALKRIRIEEYLKRELNKAGFTGMQLSKTPLVTRIVLNVTRPGLAIGKGGKTIKTLTNDIEKKFNVDNPQIEINEIKVPELDAKATVNKIISLMERGFAWKSVVFKTVEDIRKAGAMGVELGLRGKLGGKGGRKMKQRIAYGYMKKAGSFTELVDYAKGSAYPKAGAIGIKLRIIRPGTIFPDKVRISELLERQKEAKKAAEAVEKKEERVEEKERIDTEKLEEKAGEKKGIEEKKEDVEKEVKEEKAIEKKEDVKEKRKTEEKVVEKKEKEGKKREHKEVEEKRGEKHREHKEEKERIKSNEKSEKKGKEIKEKKRSKEIK